MPLRLELFVQNVEKSVHFYQDVLGFQGAEQTNSTYRPLTFGDVRIALQDIRTLDAAHPLAQPGIRGLGMELVLEVPDVQAAHARATAHASQVSPLAVQSWGLTDFRVSDPDGYYWRVTSVRAEA